VADDLHPHRIPHYALELANAFHWFYENCRVISSIQGDEEITIARLKLVASAKIVLHNTLDLMNVNAPERM
jgi:arginyl-tRNA synthetase